jgi:cobalt-zinc-cadmium efflux system outer membrane protein
MYPIHFYMILIGVFIANTVFASSSITLQQAINNTLANNPSLHVFQHEIQAKNSKIQQAKVVPSPYLSFELEDVFGTGDKQGIASAEATLKLGWVVERGVRQRYINAAKSGASLIEIEAEIKRLDATTFTTSVFYLNLAHQAREENAKKSIQLTKKTIQSIQQRVNAGRAFKADLYRAEADLAVKELELEYIEHELLSANRLLSAQWGQTIPDFNRVEGNVSQLPKVPSFEQLESQLAENIIFTKLRSEKSFNQAKLQLAQAQDTPAWKINIGAKHNNDTNEQSLVGGLAIPFGESTKNPGRIAEAQANLAKINSLQFAEQVKMKTDLFIIHKELMHNYHVIQSVKEIIIPKNQQALQESMRAYQLGRYTYSELVASQFDLLKSQNKLIEASINAFQNIIKIERLTGSNIIKNNSKQGGKNEL